VILKRKRQNDFDVLLQSCKLADRFWDRFAGFMMRKTIGQQEGILFPDCNSVHMWFVWCKLDILFLKQDHSQNTWLVIQANENVPAWKLIPMINFHADTVLEMKAGRAKELKIVVGDQLCLN
jgi:uncharacterized protein